MFFGNPRTFHEQHVVPCGIPWDGQWVTPCLDAGRRVSFIFCWCLSSSRRAPRVIAEGVGRTGRTGSPTPPSRGGMCAATFTCRATCARGNSSPSRNSFLGSGKTGESTAPRAKTTPTVSSYEFSHHSQFGVWQLHEQEKSFWRWI